jgi:hypothetical protein
MYQEKSGNPEVGPFYAFLRKKLIQVVGNKYKNILYTTWTYVCT